ncbi:MAG TPA: threonine/serine exporter family protein [Caulobacteraceae bacterium]|jgi:uncharacterized membrane protein YjjP (DUF1212 family)|nr:threonine/serine exporter family protein [Caulobacteraceae bacterium]
MSGDARAAVPPTEALELLSRAAALLFENGQTTERMVVPVGRLGEALGYRTVVLPHWGDLRIRLSGPEGSASIEIPATPLGVDMGRVGAAMRLTAAASTRDPRAAADMIQAGLPRIEREPPVSMPRFAVMAAAGAAALSVIFGASDLLSLALIGFSAGAGGVLRRWIGHRIANPFVQPASAALLAGLIGALVGGLHFSPSLRLVMVCPCMVLVPGPHLLNGALDLARTRIALGIARITFASIIVAAICVGLLVGVGVGGASLPVSEASQPAPFIWDVVAAGVAVAAYGTFFSMPWRLLPFPIAIGMLAHALRWLVISIGGADIEAGALAASLLAGTLATPVANRLNLPFAAFGFASVVSLIPGVFLFQMASGLAHAIAIGPMAPAGLWAGTAYNGGAAFMVIFAIATGLILPKMLIEHYFPLNRRAA